LPLLGLAQRLMTGAPSDTSGPLVMAEAMLEWTYLPTAAKAITNSPPSLSQPVEALIARSEPT
jgi:hypothetical protein